MGRERGRQKQKWIEKQDRNRNGQKSEEQIQKSVQVGEDRNRNWQKNRRIDVEMDKEERMDIEMGTERG